MDIKNKADIKIAMFPITLNNKCTLIDDKLSKEISSLIASYLTVGNKEDLDTVMYLDPSLKVLKSIISGDTGTPIDIKELEHIISVISKPTTSLVEVVKKYWHAVQLNLYNVAKDLYPLLLKDFLFYNKEYDKKYTSPKLEKPPDTLYIDEISMFEAARAHTLKLQSMTDNYDAEYPKDYIVNDLEVDNAWLLSHLFDMAVKRKDFDTAKMIAKQLKDKGEISSIDPLSWLEIIDGEQADFLAEYYYDEMSDFFVNSGGGFEVTTKFINQAAKRGFKKLARKEFEYDAGYYSEDNYDLKIALLLTYPKVFDDLFVGDFVTRAHDDMIDNEYVALIRADETRRQNAINLISDELVRLRNLPGNNEKINYIEKALELI